VLLALPILVKAKRPETHAVLEEAVEGEVVEALLQKRQRRTSESARGKRRSAERAKPSIDA
jgi:hypothetical protein